MNSDGTTLLHIAVETGRNYFIENLLWYITDLDLTVIKDTNGRTVLHIAASVGNKKAAELLVGKNSNLLFIKDNEDHTPLNKAYENGQHDVVSLLIDAEKETNKFRKQISDGDWLKVYAKLKKRNALTEKIDGHGYTLLHKAVEISRKNLVIRILPHMREPVDLTKIKSSDGSTVLHIAAIVGNTNAAVLLIKKNKRLFHIKDKEGKTPLHKATENEHHNTIAYLQEVDKKNDSNEFRQLFIDEKWYDIYSTLKETNALNEKIDSDGNTLLHIAVAKDVFFLIEDEVERMHARNLTDIKNFNGSTTLHIAAIVGDTDTAKILVKKNKDLLHTKDKEGHTPLDKACENMHLDTIAYLLEATEDQEKSKKEGEEAVIVDGTPSNHLPSDTIGVDLLVNAISSKRYGNSSCPC
ncbi:uncharacterized protein LOC143576566 [Bidens hawaiensis]|uniref:uncharacterized protein LOC143576566 n=1 Tax=Bidens hawaiensis TaxID=980011 RepID=UPI00404A48FA